MEGIVQDNKGRNQTAAEEHRKDEIEGEKAAAGQILSGKSVGNRNIDDQHDQRSGEGVENGVSIACPEIAHGEQVGIAFQTDAPGPEQHVAPGDQIRIADGGDHDEIHRVERDQGEERGRRVDHCVENAVGAAFADMVRAGFPPARDGYTHLFHPPDQNRDVSLIFFEMPLTRIRIRKFTRLLNSPMAAE